MKNEKGFSLVELLVVVIIIAIIAAIAIPNLLASRRAANEAAAINNLRTIHSAEVTYLSVEGANTDYGTLASLVAAGLVDSSWAESVTKSNYVFTSSIGTGVYCAMANSSDTSARDFAVDDDGTIWQSSGGTAFTCASGVRGGGGTPTVVGTTAPAPAPAPGP